MFLAGDDTMQTITVVGVFLVSFLLSFLVCTALACYVCVKMEMIEMRLIVRKPKRKLSNVCPNSRLNVYEIIEVSGSTGFGFVTSRGVVLQDREGKRASSHLYDTLLARD